MEKSKVEEYRQWVLGRKPFSVFSRNVAVPCGERGGLREAQGVTPGREPWFFSSLKTPNFYKLASGLTRPWPLSFKSLFRTENPRIWFFGLCLWVCSPSHEWPRGGRATQQLLCEDIILYFRKLYQHPGLRILDSYRHVKILMVVTFSDPEMTLFSSLWCEHTEKSNLQFVTVLVHSQAARKNCPRLSNL